MKPVRLATTALAGLLSLAAPACAAMRDAAPGPEPDERCGAPAGPIRLPLVELPATGGSSDTFAIMLSGDGGWRRIDKRVTDDLRNNGIPVVGFLTSDFLRERKTPEQSSCALERVIRSYSLRWKRSRVLLIGYSRGADILPFMVSRLPDDIRSAIRLIVYLGLEPTIDFKYHPSWLFFFAPREPQFPVKPEVEKLRGVPMLCVFGEKEGDSLCHRLDPALARPLREPGSHHFAGRYRDIAEAILTEMK
jgi:type IV secretory pathway VirJ component